MDLKIARTSVECSIYILQMLVTLNKKKQNQQQMLLEYKSCTRCNHTFYMPSLVCIKTCPTCVDDVPKHELHSCPSHGAFFNTHHGKCPVKSCPYAMQVAPKKTLTPKTYKHKQYGTKYKHIVWSDTHDASVKPYSKLQFNCDAHVASFFTEGKRWRKMTINNYQVMYTKFQQKPKKKYLNCYIRLHHASLKPFIDEVQINIHLYKKDVSGNSSTSEGNLEQFTRFWVDHFLVEYSRDAPLRDCNTAFEEYGKYCSANKNVETSDEEDELETTSMLLEDDDARENQYLSDEDVAMLKEYAKNRKTPC